MSRKQIHPDPPHLLTIAVTLMILGLLCLGVMFSAGCSLKAAQISHVAVQSADLASTHYAESRGAVEANPILKDASWPMRIALKSVATAGVIYLTNKIGREHRTVAKAVLTTINLVLVGVVANNVRIAR